MWNYFFRIQLCFLSYQTTLNDNMNFGLLTSIIVKIHGRWLLRWQEIGSMEKNPFTINVDNDWQWEWFNSAYYSGNSLYSFNFCIKGFSSVEHLLTLKDGSSHDSEVGDCYSSLGWHTKSSFFFLLVLAVNHISDLALNYAYNVWDIYTDCLSFIRYI